MREEILRARHNLLTGQDSARVDSVIRLLEQTYQRLESEAAAALVSLSTTWTVKVVGVARNKWTNRGLKKGTFLLP